MSTSRPKAALILLDEKPAQHASFARSRSLTVAALSMWARIVLSSADGEDNESIGQRLKPTKQTLST